jgi:hypothetical protein
MPNTPVEVRPGDLITAAGWNSLNARVVDLETKLQQLSGSVPTGNVSVPDVFGLSLANAKAIFNLPTQQLAMGFVVDAAGSSVDPGLQASGTRIVIGQSPAAGTKTHPGVSVNLVVSAVAGTGAAPVPKPTINPSGFSPNPVPAGTELTIGGANFAPLASDNKVFFDGMQAPQPSDSSTPTFLRVVVPQNLPNGPHKPGDPTNTNVQVLVVIGDQSAGGKCSVAAPLSEAAPPHIDIITPDPGKLNQEIVITGSGFSANAAENRVRFTGQPVEGVVPKEATENVLKVTVPKSLEGSFTTVPSTISFDVVVTTQQVNSNTKPHNIRRLV